MYSPTHDRTAIVVQIADIPRHKQGISHLSCSTLQCMTYIAIICYTTYWGRGLLFKQQLNLVSVMFHIKSDYAASKRVMYAIVKLSKFLFI